MLKNLNEFIKSKLGVVIDSELFVLALTHRSFSNENSKIAHNERLEFLGDSVLQLVITKRLFNEFPNLPEGELAKMRSVIVSQKSLAKVARELDLGKLILLGIGEEKTGGRDKDSILCDTLEAVFAAVYISSGFDESEKLILKLLDSVFESAVTQNKPLEPKSALQQFVSKKGYSEVVYKYESIGPDHKKEFIAKVYLDGSKKVFTKAKASSKKEASILAAQYALEALSDLTTP